MVKCPRKVRSRCKIVTRFALSLSVKRRLSICWPLSQQQLRHLRTTEASVFSEYRWLQASVSCLSPACFWPETVMSNQPRDAGLGVLEARATRYDNESTNHTSHQESSSQLTATRKSGATKIDMAKACCKSPKPSGLKYVRSSEVTVPFCRLILAAIPFPMPSQLD